MRAPGAYDAVEGDLLQTGGIRGQVERGDRVAGLLRGRRQLRQVGDDVGGHRLLVVVERAVEPAVGAVEVVLGEIVLETRAPQVRQFAAPQEAGRRQVDRRFAERYRVDEVQQPGLGAMHVQLDDGELLLP